MNLSGNSGSGAINIQGSNRMSSMLQQGMPLTLRNMAAWLNFPCLFDESVYVYFCYIFHAGWIVK